MLIARVKREENIIEYLLYMYQIEDIIRSFQFNIGVIDQNVIQQYPQSDQIKQEIKQWYVGLINKMQQQKIERSGHLTELKEVVLRLQELHDQLLVGYQDKQYIELYDAAKPALKELTVKTVGQNLMNQIDVAVHGIYGLLVLRLKQKEVGEETEAAMTKITAFLAYLAAQFRKMEKGELSFAKEREN